MARFGKKSLILGSDEDYLFSSVIFSDGADCSSDSWETLHLFQSSSMGGWPLVLAPCGTVSGPASAGGLHEQAGRAPGPEDSVSRVIKCQVAIFPSLELKPNYQLWFRISAPGMARWCLQR